MLKEHTSSRGWWLVLLFLLHILPFATRPALIGGDEPHYALMAYSIAVSGDLDLAEEYQAVAAGSKAAGRKQVGKALDAHVIPVGEREVFAHPLGLPLLAAPLIWLQQTLAPGSAPDILLGLLGLALTFFALWQALGILAEVEVGRETAVLVGLLIYFSTPLWFYSRTFFTEPYMASFAVLATVAVARKRFGQATVWLGLAFVLKEMAVVWILAVLGYTLERFGVRVAFRLAIGPAVAFGAFVVKNLLVYGRPIATFQPFQVGSPLEGTLGLLFDPGRGLLWFAPVLLFATLGWFFSGEVWRVERRWALFAVLGYFLITAAWIDWRGGSSYGPRLLVPVMPAFLFPLLAWLKNGAGKWPCQLLYAMALAGFVVQVCAALHPVQALWTESIFDFLGSNPVDVVVGLLAVVGIGFWLRRRKLGH